MRARRLEKCSLLAESCPGPVRGGCLHFLGIQCCRRKIQASSWRRQKGQEYRLQPKFPDGSLVCRAGRNSQGHGAVNFSATCPPSRVGEDLPSLPREATMWLVMVQGHMSTCRARSEKDASVIQSEQDGLFLLSVSLPGGSRE